MDKPFWKEIDATVRFFIEHSKFSAPQKHVHRMQWERKLERLKMQAAKSTTKETRRGE